MVKSNFETFDPADLVRFQRGYPNLVELVDDHPHDKKLEKWLVAAAGGVDAVYRVEWPRKIALAYAHTYPIDPGMHERNAALNNPEFIARMANPAPPTADTVREMLKRFMPGSDTYSGWKAPPAFYILETYLGPEVVAQAIVERLGAYTKKDWAAPRKGDGHTRIALEVLGFLMLRMDAKAKARVQASIDALVAKRPAKDMLTKHLGYLPNQPITMSMDEFSSEEGPWFMSDLTVSPEPRWKSFAGPYGMRYVDARALYMDDACDRLLTADFSGITDFSKDMLLTRIDQFGRIKHPGIVRLIVSFGRFRSVASEVQAWRDKHAAYVDSVLPMFEKDAHVQKGLAGLAGDAGKKGAKAKPKKQEPITTAQAWELTQKQFDVLSKTLPKAFSSQKKLTALIQAAVDESREIARAAGNDYLEEFFVGLWAELPFDFKPNDKQFAMLSAAYEEVVVG